MQDKHFASCGRREVATHIGIFRMAPFIIHAESDPDFSWIAELPRIGAPCFGGKIQWHTEKCLPESGDSTHLLRCGKPNIVYTFRASTRATYFSDTLDFFWVLSFRDSDDETEWVPLFTVTGGTLYYSIASSAYSH